MKCTILAAVALTVTFGFTASASAKGCLTGAAVGGVAGHVAGHHSVIGAGVGCAVGRHRANKKEKEAAAQQARLQNTRSVQPAAAAEPIKK